jgi:hypothetical protein
MKRSSIRRHRLVIGGLAAVVHADYAYYVDCSGDPQTTGTAANGGRQGGGSQG